MRPIEEAKAKVSTRELAERICAEQGKELKRAGTEYVTNCLLPDHEDRTPSFTVNPEKNVWFCHGCVRGGGVVDLAMHVWSYSQREAPMAASNVLHEFGHEIPSKPESWFRKGKRQQPVRAAMEETRKRLFRRRVFKYTVLPHLEVIEDHEERRQEIERSWKDFEETMGRIGR